MKKFVIMIVTVFCFTSMAFLSVAQEVREQSATTAEEKAPDTKTSTAQEVKDKVEEITGTVVSIAKKKGEFVIKEVKSGTEHTIKASEQMLDKIKASDEVKVVVNKTTSVARKIKRIAKEVKGEVTSEKALDTKTTAVQEVKDKVERITGTIVSIAKEKGEFVIKEVKSGTEHTIKASEKTLDKIKASDEVIVVVNKTTSIAKKIKRIAKEVKKEVTSKEAPEPPEPPEPPQTPHRMN